MNPYYGNPYGGNTYYPQPQMSWGLPPQMGGGGYGMRGVPGVYPGYPQFPQAPSYPSATRSIGGGVGWGSVQVPLAMQSGLYSSAISTSGISVNSSMGMGVGFDAGLYASAPAINSPKKMPTGRKGTVGLMLWPKENSNELAVTGTADGTSAHTSKLEVGDIICEVDGKSIKGMKPEAVAALMAGELGSYVVIKSVSGVVARIKRDISADEAEAASVPAAHGTKPNVKPAVTSPAKSVRSVASTSSARTTASMAAARVGKKLTEEECKKYNCKPGSTWGRDPGSFGPGSMPSAPGMMSSTPYRY